MIFIENKKKSLKTLEKLYSNAEFIDLTSNGIEPFIKFSPFYPHGSIPVPFSENFFSMSVEGIWQGLKVFQNEDIDKSKFDIVNMKGFKRTIRKLGKPIGHRKGINGQLLDYISARKKIYIPTYNWLLENKLRLLIKVLKEKAQVKDLVFLDFDVNEDVEETNKPLSHASLVKHYLNNNYPDIAKTRFSKPVGNKKQKEKLSKGNDDNNNNEIGQFALDF